MLSETGVDVVSLEDASVSVLSLPAGFSARQPTSATLVSNTPKPDLMRETVAKRRARTKRG